MPVSDPGMNMNKVVNIQCFYSSLCIGDSFNPW